MNDDEIEAVRQRAYHIWDREGRSHGRDEDHWLQALRDLGLDRSQRDEAREAIAAQTREWDAEEAEQ